MKCCQAAAVAAVGAPKARMAGFHGAVGRRHVNLHRKYEVQQENMRFGMVNETILAIIIAFAISAALCPVVIPFLHRLKFGQ